MVLHPIWRVVSYVKSKLTNDETYKPVIQDCPNLSSGGN